MTSASPQVRIFVAMPGSIMGRPDRWNDVDEIKRSLLEPAAERIGEQLGRKHELVIEQDKPTGVPIYDSMYSEAIRSDVYIADLTGANPNVYLELGVRWALRDGVTILIAQNIKEDVKFNVSGVRAFQYGPKPTELSTAINKIVSAAVIGLQDPHQIDSLVRKGLSLVQLPRNELQDLKDEISRLKEAQGDDLVAAARKSAPTQAIRLLRQATDLNPVSSHAHYELGVALRKAADYPGAIVELREAVKLRDDWGEAWRELAIALNKSEQLAEADQAFRRAVELNPKDDETWSTLGSLRRRLSRSPTGSFNWTVLREARDAYHHASQLRGNDTYSLLNEARIDLLLSAEEPATRPGVMSRLRRLEYLARFEADSGKPDDEPWWKALDLTDTLLLTGRVDEGVAELRSAIELIDPSQREFSLTSYIAPLRDFLALKVLDNPVAAGVREAIDVSEQAIEAARRATPAD
jgi:tetratricopeptide (TPR) repeat protein